MYTADEVNLNFYKVITEFDNIKLGDRSLFVKGTDSTTDLLGRKCGISLWLLRRRILTSD